jgi:Ribonuclease G/E
MNVRVRGIYSTALTDLFVDGDATVVQASGPIDDRFDAEFPLRPADAAVETTGDRQGVGVVGDQETATTLVERLSAVGRDAFCWWDAVPADAVFDGVVTETLRRGAVVDLGDGAWESAPDGPASLSGPDREGFLPFEDADERVSEGDHLRVQVREPAAPWDGDRPRLDTSVQLPGELATLVRRGTRRSGTGAADIVDLISSDPPDGWGLTWGRLADDAEFAALDDALAGANERASAVDDALASAEDPEATAPSCVWRGSATAWCWFGRESRFALDDRRGEVVATMTGHHRIKAGTDAASAAVDFAEAICEPTADADGDAFPFDVVTRQFGPRDGDEAAIGHGKPDGRYISLGRGEVTAVDPTGSVTVRRELSPGGTLDALGVDIEAGDVAVTKFTEGRWWYATVYRDADDERKGTYVNVCTPVELFPRTVRYVDLHVDVVKHADGTVQRVDDDELDGAVASGHVSEALAAKAQSVAAGVEDAL